MDHLSIIQMPQSDKILFMKNQSYKFLKFLLVLCALACGTSDMNSQTPSPTQGTANQTDITGNWSMSMSFPDKGISTMSLPEMNLKQTGTTVTGTMSGTDGIKGTIEGSNVSLTITFKSATGNGGTLFKGKVVNANTMQGTVNMLQLGFGNWTASR